MKSGKSCLVVLVVLFFLVSACRDENGTGDYSGVSELISERHKARSDLVKKRSEEKTTQRIQGPKASEKVQGSNPQKDNISSIVLYEEQIEIVGAESGRKLAKGIAYISKEGQIVRIKIIKE